MNNIALSRSHIKRRVDQYLWADESESLIRLRKIIYRYFTKYCHTLVLGGLVRDLAFGGVRAFKSDVDLVVDAPNSHVIKIAIALGASANRFGGFSATVGGWKIDFWALRNTWAHREKHVRIGRPADITKCTFFTADAIAYDLNKRSLHARPEYLRDMRKNVLEINLLPNPSIHGNLLRAVRRTLIHRMNIGPQLREFVTEHLDDRAFEYIIDTELRLYGHSYGAIYGDAEALREAVKYPGLRKVAKAHRRDQYLLAI